MNDIDSIAPKKTVPPQIISQVGVPKVSVLSRPLPQKKPKKILKKILLLIIMAILVLGVLVAVRASNLSDKIFVGQKISFFQKIKLALRGTFGGETLIGERLGQINILLLGIGGEGHDGPFLTDTMILAQIRPDIGQIVLTSVPRDYLAELPEGLGQRKINSAFAEGFNRNKSYKEAGQWSMETIEKISGLKIPYFAVVDFKGFEKAINLIGGVDVRIDKTFTDYEYPDENKGYLSPLTFEEGLTHMDGVKALQFSRSRHGNNGEGSDFARSLRQQKVMSAFKIKVLNLNLISDAGTINRLLGTFADHFHTNIGPSEMFRLYKIITEKNIQKFLSISLDQESGLLCSKILEENSAWVLVPCEGKSKDDIKLFFQNSFALGALRGEKSVVWLGAGPNNKQAYGQADKILKQAGLTVWEIGYSKEIPTENLVFQVNPKPATLDFIKKNLNATEVTLPPPGIKIDSSKVDMVVILGQNK